MKQKVLEPADLFNLKQTQNSPTDLNILNFIQFLQVSSHTNEELIKSVRNVFKELETDTHINKFETNDKHAVFGANTRIYD